MRRFLILGGFVALGVLLLVLSFVFRSDRTSGQNMVRARGRTGTESPTTQETHTWTGTLIDAGCPDRSREALLATPAGGMPGGSAEGSADRQAHPDNADAMAHQVPDSAGRQSDAGCAVSGATRAFAVHLPNGELKNLDEGGNTRALALFQGTPEGQDVLAGRARGVKPRVSVTGIAAGDRIVADSVTLAR